ncbi:hypothetical protein [Paracidovorax avenae]|uniref:hypothetical protein n=1 Tax=Paracidovorax avenae TaxID=80867 RepID=UPI00128ED48A|nr:hypothetical protein [Paracidovorax avenae]
MDETAKAVQEVAKTTGKVVDVVHDAGEFLAPHVDGVMAQIVNIITDHLRYVRGVRLVRLGEKFQQEVLARGGLTAVRKLPLNFAIDALEQGAMRRMTICKISGHDYLQMRSMQRLKSSLGEPTSPSSRTCHRSTR